MAADCAETAVAGGAEHVEMFALEKIGEMPLTPKELNGLIKTGVHVTGRTSVTGILTSGGRVKGLRAIRVSLPVDKKFHPSLVKPVKGTEQDRGDLNYVIIAIGSRPAFKPEGVKGVFFAGDVQNGPTTGVEAVAAGKNAGLEADAFLNGGKPPVFASRVKSRHVLEGRNMLPVPVGAEFFGRKIRSPFLLSAAPPSDGYEQMKRAYEAGWAGGIMKT
ncbi:MAG: dihydropyrimidine dehydrogenase, partial [bacterium]